MEKNFSKNPTPPRSASQMDTFVQNTAIPNPDIGLSSPKFHVNMSPSSRQQQQQQQYENDDRFTSNKQQSKPYNYDGQFNSPRLSVNSLSQNFNKTDEYKYNYDGGYSDQSKSRNNSVSSGNNNPTRMVKNYPEQQNALFNDLYNNPNPKATMPIFIDDLEEETILDVTKYLMIKQQLILI